MADDKRTARYKQKKRDADKHPAGVRGVIAQNAGWYSRDEYSRAKTCLELSKQYQTPLAEVEAIWDEVHAQYDAGTLPKQTNE